ncbi:ABC transporter substrate-binding protein, partial [Salmonella enterica subsp. enterica serovar Enteritidis]|nr:ABC transporter substrate-binding protein [Salmonella enterica subsp. enterica serovar Enteritidis]
MLRREKQKQRIIWDKLMIKGKLALVTCALTLVFTSSLFAASDTADGRTLKLAIGPEPTEGFDPMLGWSHGSYLLLHAPLLKQNADMSWGNLLTEKVDTSPVGKIWTLTLKPGLKFSDGSPLTAEDVVFTYNKAAKSGGKIDMGNFSHARALDARRIEMTLSHPQSTFVNVLGSLGIVPASRYDEKTFAREPIGAGPYRLVSFQPG